MAMDEESIGHLEDAKNGQKRQFVMLCSGDKVLSLVVFKTGSLDQQKKKAKDAGTGKLTWGETKGKGPNLVFEVSRAEGFKEAPVSDQKLKKFIADEAEITLTPSFDVVDEHGKAPAPAPTPAEKPKSEASDKEQSKSPPPQQKKDEPPKSDPAVQKKMQTTLDRLGPLVKVAVQNAPDRKMELLREYDRLKKGIQGDKAVEFRDDLVAYGALLKELAAPKSGGGGQEERIARQWAGVIEKWGANKDAQMAAVKDTMNALGNLALDNELDPAKVNALISELSTYVPTFEKLTDALDDALEAVEVATDQETRRAAIKSVNATAAELKKFYTSQRIQKLLADFDGKDFFNPTEESLQAIGKLAG